MKNFKFRNLVLVICLLISVMLVVCACTENVPEASEESTSESIESSSESSQESEEDSSEIESEIVDPNKVTYTFTVTNSKGEPVETASVNLCVGEDKCLMPVFTDANGIATITTDKGVVYDMKVICNGYTTATGTVSEDITEYEITLLGPAGAEDNPVIVDFVWGENEAFATATVTVPANSTFYFGSYRNISGMYLSINGGESVLLEGNVMNPPVFTITNDTDAEATYSLSISYPVGAYMNPEAVADITSFTVNVAEGNDQGYYYTWTASESGTLTITCPAVDGIQYAVNLTNRTAETQAWLADSEDGTVSIEVNADDQIIIQVVVSPDDSWNIPALETTLSGVLTASESEN